MLIFLYEPFYDRICPAHKAHVGSQKAHLSLCLEWIGGKDSHRMRHVGHPFLLGRPNPHIVHMVRLSLQRKRIPHATACMAQKTDPNYFDFETMTNNSLRGPRALTSPATMGMTSLGPRQEYPQPSLIDPAKALPYNRLASSPATPSVMAASRTTASTTAVAVLSKL